METGTKPTKFFIFKNFVVSDGWSEEDMPSPKLRQFLYQNRFITSRYVRQIYQARNIGLAGD